MPLEFAHKLSKCPGMVRKLDIELAPKTNKFDPKPTFTCDDPVGNTNTGQ